MVAKVRVNFPLAVFASERAASEFMEVILQEIAAGAKAIAATGTYATGGADSLAESIEIQGPLIVGTQIRGAVGSRKEYASSVHDGARRHDIFPKGAVGIIRYKDHKAPQLKFYWRREGRVAFFPHIPGSPRTAGRSHPGIRYGKKFLEIPMVAVARRHGLKFKTRDV
jgi:hypothetical protein